MTLSRTASTESILRLLEMAISDKKRFADAAGCITPYDIFGVMEHVFSDGGSAINNRDVHTVLRDLFVGFHCPPGGVPKLRGMAERMFRSIDEGLLSWFEGRTFTDSVAKGTYDSESRAGTTVDELGRMLILFAVDCHHNKGMAALGGKTPREEYLRLTREYGVWGTPDPNLLRNIFGVDVDRVLTPGGVQFLNIRYRSRRLHKLYLEKGPIKLKCRIHAANLGAISVKISNKEWLTVRTSKAFHGVDAESWIGAEAELRKHEKYMKQEVTGPIINHAVREFERVAQIGRKRADISDTYITRGIMLAAEARMKVYAAYPDEEYDDAPEPSTDIYETCLQVGQSAPEHGRPSPSPSRRASRSPKSLSTKHARLAKEPSPQTKSANGAKAQSKSSRRPVRSRKRAQRRRPGFRRTFTLQD